MPIIKKNSKITNQGPRKQKNLISLNKRLVAPKGYQQLTKSLPSFKTHSIQFKRDIPKLSKQKKEMKQGAMNTFSGSFNLTHQQPGTSTTGKNSPGPAVRGLIVSNITKSHKVLNLKLPYAPTSRVTTAQTLEGKTTSSKSKVKPDYSNEDLNSVAQPAAVNEMVLTYPTVKDLPLE